MFEKIVVPIELTELDGMVLQYVTGLCDYGIKEVVLVHVAGLKGMERPVAVRQEERFREEIEACTSIIENAGFKAKPVLTTGTPHDEIIRAAKEECASLIVTGTRGKGAFNELATGSVSEMIGRKADVPVLMVPYRSLADLSPEGAARMGRTTFERVLYPTDFSDISERTLETIKSLDRDKIGEVVVAHVLEPKELRPEHKEAVLRSTQRILAAIKDELSVDGFNARGELVVGAVVAELMEMAEETKATCFIVGSHGRGIGEELFLGSISQNLIRMCRKPVVITH